MTKVNPTDRRDFLKTAAAMGIVASGENKIGGLHVSFCGGKTPTSLFPSP